jgi:hypothetical protein
MAFRNNKLIFVPESKKADIYEAAGVSRRTNSQVEGVGGESTKSDQRKSSRAGRMTGTETHREKEQGPRVHLFSVLFFLFLLFLSFL